jgi:L-ascorbate metabolism protein UlaG (beta-lactamase superfamily)
MPIAFHGVAFERLGHASLRIETQDGTVIYVDPWSEVLDGDPQDGDVVLVTHGDFDHYDPNGITAVAGPRATVAVFDAVDTSALDTAVVDLPHEGAVEVDDLVIQTVPAYNAADGDHLDDSGEPFHLEGDGVGLVLTLDETVVFVPSDTDYLPHHERMSVDVFIPPIGGHYTMDRHDAAAFARSVEPELVIPIHYDTFEAIETDVDAFAEELEADGIRVEVL